MNQDGRLRPGILYDPKRDSYIVCYPARFFIDQFQQDERRIARHQRRRELKVRRKSDVIGTFVIVTPVLCLLAYVFVRFWMV